MRFVGIVLARGGSKRLPDKNLSTVGGRSLVLRAVETGVDAGLQTVVLSSDSEEILLTGTMGCGPQVKRWRRAPEFATDEASSIDAVREVAREMAEAFDADAYVLLQPTSPLRTPGDIIGATQMFADRGAQSVFSVAEMAMPDWVYRLGHLDRLRPVDRPPGLYMPNGAIYIISREALDQGLDWFTAPASYGYRMPRERSIDIDTAADLEAARAWAESHGWV